MLCQKVRSLSRAMIRMQVFRSFSDYVIPRFPVVHALRKEWQEKFPESFLEDVCVVGNIHVLGTMGALVEELIEFGIPSEQFYVMGKCYSTSPLVAEAMENLGVNVFPDPYPTFIGGYETASYDGVDKIWGAFLEEMKEELDGKKLIILDDGGRCAESIPTALLDNQNQMVAIEQTQGGLNVLDELDVNCPVIEVASSAVKKIVEPLFIPTSVFDVLPDIFQSSNAKDNVYGVIGYGAIGHQVCRDLHDLGAYNIHINDPTKTHLVTENQTDVFHDDIDFIKDCDVVFGCTGNDFCESEKWWDDLLTHANGITFVSCGSEDREFSGLFRALRDIQLDEDRSSQFQIEQDGPLGDIFVYDDTGAPILDVVYAGFPANFCRLVPVCVPDRDIEITVCLLLSAVLQGLDFMWREDSYIDYIDGDDGKVMLDTELQRKCFEMWSGDRNDIDGDVRELLMDIDKIKEHSGGSVMM